jgi:hypothetical protein
MIVASAEIAPSSRAIDATRLAPGLVLLCSRCCSRAAMLLLAATLACVLAAAHAAPDGGCTSSADCHLNGDCTAGKCVCDSAWSASPDCAVMSFAEVEKEAGKAPGYYNATEASWGGFPIKNSDGKWNLIHAQMANHCPLGSWTSNSIVARSVSTSGKPEGPYEFAEELLPPFAHNPTIRKAEDGTYVIFFIGGWTTNASHCSSTAEGDAAVAAARTGGGPPSPPCKDGSNWPKSCGPHMPGDDGQTDCCGSAAHGNNAGCGIATATSKSLSGPWEVKALNIVDQWLSDDVYCTHTNPTIQILKNGTWIMAFNAGYCNKHLETIGTAVSHGGYKGPWHLLSRNSVLKNPDGTPHKCEDPHIWSTKRGWHLLTHNQEGPQRGSSYGYSLDGHSWTLSPTTPYDCGLNYTDGTTGEASGCGNRPQIFWSEDGETPLFIINGAMTAKPGGGKGTWTLFRPLTQPK